MLAVRESDLAAGPRYRIRGKQSLTLGFDASVGRPIEGQSSGGLLCHRPTSFAW